MHCILHADDTAKLSTDRNLFVSKWNHMLRYFKENNLSLNLSKSAYLIINGKDNDYKSDLTLANGLLEYKSVVTYLGVLISDIGSTKHDIGIYVDAKRSNVLIKFGNFICKNELAPINIRLEILDSCVTAALVYGCESWGGESTGRLESIYRMGLKRALSIRVTTNDDITYIEAGRFPLSMRIRKLTEILELTQLSSRKRLHDTAG